MWRVTILTLFDEKKDADILKVLRTNTLSPETDIEALLREGEELEAEIEKLSAPIAPLEKRLKVIKDIVKEHAISQFRDGDKKVSMSGGRYQWDVSKTSTTKINKDGLKADGLLEKYSTTEVGYRCVQAHTSQDDWTPDAAASLWSKVGNPAEEYPAWSQPIGSHDAYGEGDKVTHNEKKWVSTCNANVWEPGVYGWEEVSE